MTTYSKRLLLGVSIMLFLCQSLAAEQILVRYKTGGSGLVEVLGVSGQSVRLKNPQTGNTKTVPLKTFDEATLIRLVLHLGKQLDVIASPQAKPTLSNSMPKITANRIELFPERYVGKTVVFEDLKLISVTKTLADLYVEKSRISDLVFFCANDASGKLVYGFHGDKRLFAEQLLKLKTYDKMTVTVRVGQFEYVPGETNINYRILKIE